jgi:hypothetical protein
MTSPEPRPEPDEFDRIVAGLNLDLSFPDEPAEPAPVAAAQPTSDDEYDEPDDEPEQDPFYRQVDRTPLLPRNRNTLAAWFGVVLVPLMVLLAWLANIYMGKGVLMIAAAIFVASAAYLFLQLPEHGPARRDWPDDGAVL